MAYCTEADVRDISEASAVSDPSEVDTARITEAIAFAEDLIDDYCGTSFEYKAFTATLDGNAANNIRLIADNGRTIMYPQTIIAATIDGTSVDFSGWKLHRHGVIVWPNGTFSYATGGRNIVISGTAGISAAPSESMKQACAMIARQKALEDYSRSDPRAITITDELGGQTLLAQPGKRGPTGIPQVNDILKRAKRRSPGVA